MSTRQQMVKTINRYNSFIARQLPSAERFRVMRWTHRALLLQCPKQNMFEIHLWRLRGKSKQFQVEGGMRRHVFCVWAGVRHLLQIRQRDGCERMRHLRLHRSVQGQLLSMRILPELPRAALRTKSATARVYDSLHYFLPQKSCPTVGYTKCAYRTKEFDVDYVAQNIIIY